jgi:hypothetical protein
VIEAVAMNFWDKNYHPEFGLIEDAEECRLLLRPQRAGRVEMRHRHSGMWWAAPCEVVGHPTRAQAAQAAAHAVWEQANKDAITQDDRDRT